jgi:DNA-binding response OmpR family regulator
MSNLTTAIRRIVHIDDDEDDFLMLQEAIKALLHDAEVLYLSDCPSRLNMIVDPQPDLVFLDINMHGNDGFYWLEKIRAKGLTTLPVIMYSTANTYNYISKAYTAGANLFFIKPQTFTELVESLRHLFQMDWTTPSLITEAHYRDGKYHPFRLN